MPQRHQDSKETQSCNYQFNAIGDSSCLRVFVADKHFLERTKGLTSKSA
jgi:hypothetical protein